MSGSLPPSASPGSPGSPGSPVLPASPIASDPGPTPGQQFVAAYAAGGKAARVELPRTITEQFPGFSRRPRLAMRNLFKIVKTGDAAASYWFETHPDTGAGPVRDQALRSEAGFEFRFGSVPLSPITAWVQIPPPLLDDRDALASFLDFRLLVRLGTAENQVLARGPGGLLAAPGIRRLPPGPDPVTSLLMACDHVELMGGSADGIVMNTTDYYRYLVPRADVVASLAALGIRIARTRMIPAGSLVVGDFLAGTTIFDSGRSTIAFDQPPAGTFARDGVAVRAEIRTALAIHLPTHLFVAALVPGAQDTPS